MNDLISRQDAVEATRYLQTYKLFESDDMLLVDLADVQTTLMMLQSAQQWIPCIERMPERNGYYLVTGRLGAVNKRLYQDGYWYGNWAITAWMPMPEPFKDKHED